MFGTGRAAAVILRAAGVSHEAVAMARPERARRGTLFEPMRLQQRTAAAAEIHTVQFDELRPVDRPTALHETIRGFEPNT